MPDGMPFMKQKGWATTLVEQSAQTDKGTLFDLLVELHDPARRVGAAIGPFLAAHTLGGELVRHLRKHWFGEHDQSETGAGPWIQQAAFSTDPNNPVLETGFWINYYGDVEGIVRVVLIRAIERLLDLNPVDFPQAAIAIQDQAAALAAYERTDRPVGTSTKRLEVWWLCPQPRFEAALEATAEVVRIDFMTPAPRGGVLGTGYRKTDVGPFVGSTGMGGPVPKKMEDVFDIVGGGGKQSIGQHAQPQKVTVAESEESWLVGQDCIEPKNAFDWFKIENTPFHILDPFTRFVGKGDPATIDIKADYGGRP